MMNRGSRRIDRLFEVALILLTVLAATEFQFVCSMPDRQKEIPYAFKVLTYPIVSLIVLWLVKEFAFPLLPRHLTFKMAYTEFCWYFWANTLYIYLIFYLLFAYGSVSLIQALCFLGLSGLLALVVSLGYQKAEPGMVYFRRRWKRLVRSVFIYTLALGLTWLMFQP